MNKSTNIWLGKRKGYLTDWITQMWVKVTGQAFPNPDINWLLGPTAGVNIIGQDYFETLAKDLGYSLNVNKQSDGLLPIFDLVDEKDIDEKVLDFYKNTVSYSLDAWHQWCGFFKPFYWLLAFIFSRRLQQFNMPISSLDTSLGMTGEIISVSDKSGHLFTGWLRTLNATGHVVYAGCYSSCFLPEKGSTRFIKVAFPLPNGNATVIMKPEILNNRGLRLVSSGNKIGDPGFYFLVNGTKNRTHVKYVSAMKESIDVYTVNGELRADHILRFWGIVFLRLHYRMLKKTV
jgi:hypothetical protein